MEVLSIDTEDLGDRSYVVTDGKVAAVFDPQRDVDRVLELVEGRGLEITHVFETHIHNDYVSGGLELARRTGAAYLIRDADKVAFEVTPIRPGDEIQVGSLAVVAVTTPGHTPTHLSFAIRDHGAPIAVLTGGSMLYGAVGRTDLISPETTEELAHAQFRSVRTLAELPSAVTIHPTHGFGSFCSSNRHAAIAAGTIADEWNRNPALTTDDEDTFVSDLIAGFTAYPSYYRAMDPLNRSGPPALQLGPPPRLDPSDLEASIDAGDWLVDIRDRVAYANGHRRGSVNFEAGRFLPTYVGWLVPFATPLTLLAEEETEVEDARRSLGRIGYDEITGWARPTEGVEAAARFRTADFGDLSHVIDDPGVAVLDVRRDDEWQNGHLKGAVHIHLPDLPGRLADVPQGQIWVHCASGYRAAIAASLLDGAGVEVVLVDDEWEHVVRSGLEVTAEG